MSPDTTRGGLKPAKLIKIVNDQEVAVVRCMFNPYEYTLSKQNQWQEQPTRGKNVGSSSFVKGGSQTLKLTLYFDSSLEEDKDVRKYTDRLWEMMMVEDKSKDKEAGKGVPPEVAFEWGRLYFRAVLTNMSQKYTLFTEDGTPVRCQVDITLEQKIDREDYRKRTDPPPMPDVGTEVTAVAGDRIDNIAAGSAAPSMRDIAEANNIDNPLNIPSGARLKT